MSNSILHILNGDSSKNLFPTREINGEIVVWREALVQGPLFYLLGSELFWEMRSQFIERAYGSKLFEYKNKVIQEFQKIKRFQGNEIVLWFEYDLFCQINMIAIISYLLRSKKSKKISLVCIGDYPGHSKRVGLGEIPAENYPKLFKNRIKLEKEDLLLADRAWMAFCGKEIEKFEQMRSNNFKYLTEALVAAKSLFRQKEKLSPLSLHILKMIENDNINESQLIRRLLKEDTALGFGDLQFKYEIEKVSNYYEIIDGILRTRKLSK